MHVTDTIFSYPVRSLVKMKDFYRDVLGFQVEDEAGDGWTTMRSSHARVAFYPSAQCEPCMTHLMLVVDSLEEAVVELRVSRVEVTDIHVDLKLAKFKDPEGNLLAVIELPPGTA